MQVGWLRTAKPEHVAWIERMRPKCNLDFCIQKNGRLLVLSPPKSAPACCFISCLFQTPLYRSSVAIRYTCQNNNFHVSRHFIAQAGARMLTGPCPAGHEPRIYLKGALAVVKIRRLERTRQ